MTDKAPEHFNLGIADKRKIRHVTTYLTAAQKRDVMNELGLKAYALLGHYFDKVNIHSHDFSDEKVARELDWSERSVRRTRWALTRADWIIQFVYTCPKIIPTKVTVVGKELVKKYRTHQESLPEFMAKVFEATKGM